MKFMLRPGELTLADLRLLLDESTEIVLDPACSDKIYASHQVVDSLIKRGETAYGINTGFGLLANSRIRNSDLAALQTSLLLSHAAGTGKLLSDQTVRLMMILKINSLARGYSGVRIEVINALIHLVNAKVYPCVPSQGSVGASGDLAPLAHMSAVLIGVGTVRYQKKVMSAMLGLQQARVAALQLAPKEGLALLNGTQTSTALALLALFRAENAFANGIIIGALSVDAAQGSVKPFDPRIQAVRGHVHQANVASLLCQLLEDSEIMHAHETCKKVQDPYSLRCQPQVMGACWAHLDFAKATLLIEANAVSDNPIVFAEQDEILSGGNFHAEPVAMAADTMAFSIAEMGALSERRLALLIDPRFSNLPAFLVENPGLNSGFMIAQVTAAALASENKSLAHPASVDSLPTSANQEDHVSMATFAARRLLPMVENTVGIFAVELLAGCQGINFRRPYKTSTRLEKVFARVREKISYYGKDRFFAPDIAAAKKIIRSGVLLEEVGYAGLDHF